MKVLGAKAIYASAGLNCANALTCTVDRGSEQISIKIGQVLAPPGTPGAGVMLVAEGLREGSSTWAAIPLESRETGQYYPGTAMVPPGYDRAFNLDVRGLSQVRFWPSGGNFTSFNVEAYSTERTQLIDVVGSHHLNSYRS